MEIAQYHGISFQSRLIRWITRSNVSHSAFLLDEASERAAIKLIKAGTPLKRLHAISAGSVVEAWTKGGVRNTASLSEDHTPKTPVTIYRFVEPLMPSQERDLLLALDEVIGEKYDFRNVLKFVTRKMAWMDDNWFCSELVAHHLAEIKRPLFNSTEAWEVPPNWIHRSIALDFHREEVTA